MVSLSFEIVELTPSFETLFYEYIQKDVPHYFFFIFDWKFERQNTKIWLVVQHDEIYGMMLIYKNRIVQLRGNASIIEALLNKINLKKFQLQAETQHQKIILRKFRMKKDYGLLLMGLRKGEERLVSTVNIKKLTSKWASEIAYLKSSANPEFWGDTTKETIVTSMNRRLWMGVVTNDTKLVSFGNAYLTDFVSNIGSLATRESYRNRGYATEVVSALVKEIFDRNDLALISVRSNNIPAQRVCEKVGFKMYRKYLYGYVEN